MARDNGLLGSYRADTTEKEVASPPTDLSFTESELDPTGISPPCNDKIKIPAPDFAAEANVGVRQQVRHVLADFRAWLLDPDTLKFACFVLWIFLYLMSVIIIIIVDGLGAVITALGHWDHVMAQLIYGCLT